MPPHRPLGPFSLGLVPPSRPIAFTWAAMPPAELPAGYVVGDRYRVDAALSLTGPVQLYRATDRRSGQPVKLKRMPVGRDDELTWREVAILSGLNHPRLPAARPTFEESGEMYFVQTFLEGPTLRQYFKAQGTLPRAMVPVVLASALEVLDYLHSLPTPVIHRDVKPANMVVMPGDRLGLIDFDIASHGCRRKRNVPLNDLTTAYTVGYAPPEQIIGREAFPASDLYALATSVIYAATGKHPIHQWNARRGRITVPRGFGAGLTRLLTWMLEPSLDDRCPTAKAAMAELKHLRLA